jgi:maleylpyruvate isomerase
MKLYGYWRSSCSWRVRIALNLKGLSYEYLPVNLAEGVQHRAEYRAVSPSGTVPTLELVEGGRTIRLQQSLAILEYLEELHPTPALLPRDPVLRARARMLAELINSGIQPLQNLKVIQYVEGSLKGDKKAFAAHFIREGLEALEKMAQESAGAFLVGEQPTFADICLVPQLYGARRFGVDLEPFPLLLRVEKNCNENPAFAAAHADKQPDAVR